MGKEIETTAVSSLTPKSRLRKSQLAGDSNWRGNRISRLSWLITDHRLDLFPSCVYFFLLSPAMPVPRSTSLGISTLHHSHFRHLFSLFPSKRIGKGNTIWKLANLNILLRDETSYFSFHVISLGLGARENR